MSDLIMMHSLPYCARRLVWRLSPRTNRVWSACGKILQLCDIWAARIRGISAGGHERADGRAGAGGSGPRRRLFLKCETFGIFAAYILENMMPEDEEKRTALMSVFGELVNDFAL